MGKGQAAQLGTLKELWPSPGCSHEARGDVTAPSSEDVPRVSPAGGVCVLSGCPLPVWAPHQARVTPWEPFQQAQGMLAAGSIHRPRAPWDPRSPTAASSPPCLLSCSSAPFAVFPGQQKQLKADALLGSETEQAYLPAQLSSGRGPLYFSPCGRTEPVPTWWPKRSQVCQRERGCSHPCPFWGAPPAPRTAGQKR